MCDQALRISTWYVLWDLILSFLTLCKNWYLSVCCEFPCDSFTHALYLYIFFRQLHNCLCIFSIEENLVISLLTWKTYLRLSCIIYRLSFLCTLVPGACFLYPWSPWSVFRALSIPHSVLPGCVMLCTLSVYLNSAWFYYHVLIFNRGLI